MGRKSNLRFSSSRATSFTYINGVTRTSAIPILSNSDIHASPQHRRRRPSSRVCARRPDSHTLPSMSDME